MEDKSVSSRIQRICTQLGDVAEENIGEHGKRAVTVMISDAAIWLMNTYEKIKKNLFPKTKLKNLQEYIEANGKAVQIGMEKKEIAVMWAMRKLGYTEDQTHEILSWANKAYLPKGEW